MTGRDLGHVITWDFLIFLLKRGYLIKLRKISWIYHKILDIFFDNFMIFFDTRDQPIIYYCHKPAQSAQMNSEYSFGPPNEFWVFIWAAASVTSPKLSITPAARGVSTQLSWNFGRNAKLYHFRSQLNQRNFEVKTVPKLRPLDLVIL